MKRAPAQIVDLLLTQRVRKGPADGDARRRFGDKCDAVVSMRSGLVESLRGAWRKASPHDVAVSLVCAPRRGSPRRSAYFAFSWPAFCIGVAAVIGTSTRSPIRCLPPLPGRGRVLLGGDIIQS